MDTIETLTTRRSVRKYTDAPVSEEDVNDFLKAAMCAPSAGDERPWHFVVVRDKAVLKQLADVPPRAGMVQEAPVSIVVCVDEKLEKYKGFWPQDCAVATQNILLAAHAKGFGSVWTGIYPVPGRVESFRKVLGLPENVIPFSLIPIGGPAETPPADDRFDATRVHRERW